MIEATAAQKMQLAKAFVRMAREALRDTPTGPEAGTDFGVALFECPDGFEDVARLLPTLCHPDELPGILDMIAAFTASPP
jgi:hypothetical protein